MPSATSLRRSESRFIIGHWNDLIAEQRRLFIAYVIHNYSGDIGGGDPAKFAEKLWNDSVDEANSGGVVDNDRLLELSQLTTFIGVTSLWEKRQVSDQVVLVTNINGDQPKNNFRIFGTLASGGGEVIKEVFDHSIFGSDHGEYSVSRREQGLWGQPNGQFSMTPDLLRYDSDVDYRRLLSPGHNTKENSDIMAFDGGTPHLTRHIKRYGPVPIKMERFDDIMKRNESSVLSYERANQLFDEFRGRFESELCLASVVNDLFSGEALQHIKETGFFAAWGLNPKLVLQLDDDQLTELFIQLMDFYYLYAISEMNVKDLSSGETILPASPEWSTVQTEIKNTKYLRTLIDPDATDDQSVEINDKWELDAFIQETIKVTDPLRQNLRATAWDTELYRQNLEQIDAQRPNPFRMDRAYRLGRTTFVLERGIYVLLMIEEDGTLRILNLGIGN